MNFQFDDGLHSYCASAIPRSNILLLPWSYPLNSTVHGIEILHQQLQIMGTSQRVLRFFEIRFKL